MGSSAVFGLTSGEILLALWSLLCICGAISVLVSVPSRRRARDCPVCGVGSCRDTWREDKGSEFDPLRCRYRNGNKRRDCWAPTIRDRSIWDSAGDSTFGGDFYQREYSRGGGDTGASGVFGNKDVVFRSPVPSGGSASTSQNLDSGAGDVAPIPLATQQEVENLLIPDIMRNRRLAALYRIPTPR